MKKELRIGITFLIIYFNLPAQVTIEGRQFKDENGNDFYPVVSNYGVFALPDPTDPSKLLISPHGNYGASSINFECACDYNQPPCSTLLENDLKYVLSMGFNAIRVMGFEVVYHQQGSSYAYNIPGTAPEDGFYWLVTSCTWVNWHFIPISNNPQNQTLLFQSIIDFLTIVHNTYYGGKTLKVTLLTGRLHGQYSDTFASMYAQFLDALATYINSQQSEITKTLLAYDIFNEPGKEDLGGPSKKNICQNCKMWYYALKEKDPNHLVTLGAGNHPHGSGPYDVLNNDVQVLTLDFYSPHEYPSLRQFEYDNTQYPYLDAQLERLHGTFYWLQQNSPMPWMVGECGLGTQQNPNANPTPNASTDFNAVNGTLADQYNFVADLLAGVFNCSGSGFSFWDYQGSVEKKYGLLYPNRAIAPPSVPCDPPPQPDCHSPDDVKPAHKVFESFSPAIGVCQKPEQYNDPYKHKYFQTHPPSFQIKYGPSITGWVFDIDQQNMIEDAYIEIETDLLNLNNDIYYDNYYTYSGSDGQFTAIPMNYFRDDVEPPIVGQIEISAPGGGYIKRNWPQDSETYYIHKARFKFSDFFDFSNATISNGPKIIQAWNDLTVKNVVFNAESGNGNEIKARRTISVLDEFYAEKNSDVHIYTTSTFSDCSEIPEGPIEKNLNIVQKIKSDNHKSIEMTFINLVKEFDFDVIPNPNNGIFTIFIKDEEDIMPEYHTVIFSTLGNSVFESACKTKSQKLNLNKFSKGLYIIRIDQNNISKTKKLIIN